MGSVWTKSTASSASVPLVSARPPATCPWVLQNAKAADHREGRGRECVWAEHEEVIKVATWEETMCMLRWGAVSAGMSSKTFVA